MENSMGSQCGGGNGATRRQVLKAVGMGAVGSALPRPIWKAVSQELTNTEPRQIVVDKTPLAPGVFTRLPLGSIQAREATTLSSRKH